MGPGAGRPPELVTVTVHFVHMIAYKPPENYSNLDILRVILVSFGTLIVMQLCRLKSQVAAFAHASIVFACKSLVQPASHATILYCLSTRLGTRLDWDRANHMRYVYLGCEIDIEIVSYLSAGTGA